MVNRTRVEGGGYSKHDIIMYYMIWCEGISPLGYWQKVNQSPTQTKPYNTLPPFEPRDSWSSYGAVRAYSEVLL